MKNKYSKIIVFILCLWPIAIISLNIFYNELGAEPVKKIMNHFGEWTLIFICLNLISQENSPPKTQPTNFLSKSYYSINFGGIFYPFSNNNLIDGYATETFSRNYFSGRMLLGYKIQPNLAVQFGTLRPAAWFKYDNVNNIGYYRSVWINAWSLSLKKNISLNKLGS